MVERTNSRAGKNSHREVTNGHTEVMIDRTDRIENVALT